MPSSGRRNLIRLGVERQADTIIHLSSQPVPADRPQEQNPEQIDLMLIGENGSGQVFSPGFSFGQSIGWGNKSLV